MTEARMLFAILAVFFVGGIAVVCLVVETWQPPETRGECPPAATSAHR